MPKLPFVIGTGTLYLPPPPIVGTDFDDTIYGTANADEIYGRKGHDTLFGGAGNDWLFGEEGDDLLCGGIGADRLDGGIGSDTADYTNSAAGVNVNLATNAATGGDAQGDTFFSIENINGSNYDDVLQGTDDANMLIGNDGNDTLKGGGGSDWLDGGNGSDLIFAGDGDDTLRGGIGADYLDGGAGTDTARYSWSFGGVHVDLAANLATGGDAEGDSLVNIENLQGSAFADILQGTDTANVLKGGGGDDRLEGRGGADILITGSGNDVLDGGAGRDVLFGGYGNDRMFGGNDDDEIHGEAGDDLIDGGHGADKLFGDEGIDTLSYASSTGGVNVNIDTGAVSGGYAFLDTIHNFENVTGSQFADVLVGTDGIGFSTQNGNGEIADNVMRGLGGDDQIDGRDGHDRIDGGTGNDWLTGGADSDIFMFQAVDQLPSSHIPAPPGDDIITDFQVGVDQLEFSGIETLYDLNFQEVNGNAVITYAHATGSITLTGVSLDQLLLHASHDLILA